MADRLTGAVIDETWYIRLDNVPEHISAGGIVVRHTDGKTLIALARERDYREYVLPKGHLEPGEDAETAARREIAEEVGVTDLRLLKPLGVKERLSFDKRSWKRTHYFLYATDQVEATPEDTEHHNTMEWFPVNRLPDMFWPEQRKLVEANAREIEGSVR
jgi:8-oxo-dGTP pyrophosphatase MutT (NUDIX family)